MIAIGSSKEKPGRGRASCVWVEEEWGQVFPFSSVELDSQAWQDRSVWSSLGRCTTSPRGDGCEDIYRADGDRRLFLDVLGDVWERCNWTVHAYCLMTNHYHLLVETPDANLAKGMRQLNGVYTQRFNRTYERVGHVFQGRYKAILVQKETYLLELARYVVLNPVRARMVPRAPDWPWSSYRAMVGEVAAPEWLQRRGILAAFGETEAEAVAHYVRFVAEGKGQPAPWERLQHQVFLGSDAFVEAMRRKVPRAVTCARSRRPRRGHLKNPSLITRASTPNETAQSLRLTPVAATPCGRTSATTSAYISRATRASARLSEGKVDTDQGQEERRDPACCVPCSLPIDSLRYFT